ncbi:MAG TPA: hypothetical protein V6D17_08340 [Candidatus Obscuribacterales bacterium]
MVANANSNLETFTPSFTQVADASPAFQSEVFDSTIGQRMTKPADVALDMTLAMFNRPADAPKAPEGVDPASWAQISKWIGEDKNVQFTTADSGKVPDYILGADGKLTRNPAKTTPNADGSVTIQVESSAGKEAAAKAAQALKVAAVQEKIYYWQKANPGATDIPEYLKGMLHAAQSQMPAVADSTQQQQQPQRVETQPQPQREVSAPSGGYTGGGSTGGGMGGERIGNRNIGSAPSGGYRPGRFEPDAPIDRTAIPKPVEGDLAIKGPPSCTVEQIQDFLTKMGSPAAKEEGFSQALYDACTERGIDPAVAVGFFLQESTCGRYGRARENLSLGNIKGRAPESGGTDGTFRKYNSWAEGARDWARLIDESYVQKRGLETLSQVISVYAPSSDGNNESRYVATVKGVVENFKKQNGGTAVA